MIKNDYCVYKHTSPSGKVYIGYTGKNPPSERWRKDGIGYSNKKATIFYKAILKYGWENFTTEILKDNLTLKEALELEKYYIDLYNSTNNSFGYNQTKGGIGGIGGSKKGRIMSDSFKQKRREATVGEKNPNYGKECSDKTKLKISNANKGRTLNEEQRKHVSEGHKGHIGWNKGKKFTEEQKKNFGKKMIGRKHINNGIIEKIVSPDEFDFYLNNGWVFGCLHKRSGWKMTEKQKEKLRKPKPKEFKEKLSKIQKEKVLNGTANFTKGNYYGYKNKEEYFKNHNSLPSSSLPKGE